MITKTWHELCRFVASPVVGDDSVVCSLKSDSRRLQSGDVFLALPGKQQHGVAYALAAKNMGAMVIADQAAEGVDIVVPNLSEQLGSLLNWFYDAPSTQLALVGITGTNGKTSTSHYLAQWLFALGKKVAVIGTVGNGLWGGLSTATHTTPDAASLYHQLALWVTQGVDVVVMEVSSHAIDQQRIVGLSFAVVALTQVTRDHLDYHGTVENYQSVKARLFTDWSSGAQVLNVEDVLGSRLRKQLPNVCTYGHDVADIVCKESAPLPQGMQVTLCYQDTCWSGVLPLYGVFNVDNVLCALSCGVALGFAMPDLLSKLSATKAVLGRMQAVWQHPITIVDYAHTPDALEKVLAAAKAHLGQGALWVVFGAGGDRDVGKRPLMGAIADQYADYLIVTDDNPRSEAPENIAQHILSGVRQHDAIYIANRQEAICSALKRAGSTDIVLIAGKGHEDYQEIAGVRYPFSDSEAVQKCMV
jgi:UDP-N-acetylmuramoyl-L-alanyl-D-glutamate--2,6-diaminopimelate ligase